MFITALFTGPKTWNQPKCPSVVTWTKKMQYIYTKEYYATIKKNKIMCSNMDGAGHHYPKQINEGIENQILHILTYKWEWNTEYLWRQGNNRHQGLLEGWEWEEGEDQKTTYRDQAWWLTPVIQALWRPRWADHLRLGVQDQSNQHGETPFFFLLKSRITRF